MPAPANDNVVNAIALIGTSGTVTGDNTGGTNESANETGWYSGAPTIWYSYHNTTGVTKRITINNVVGDSGFNSYGGAEADGWPYPISSPASGFDDLYTYSNLVVYIADPVYQPSYPSRYIDVSAGQYAYIALTNWFYSPSGVGVISFDWAITTPPPPPANDNFVNAVLLNSVSGTLQGTNVSATTEGATDPLGSLGRYRTVWYKLNPYTTDKALTIGTDVPLSGVGAVDTYMGVYRGTTLASLTQIALDDDSGPGNYSQLTNIIIPANETIYIEIAGFNSNNEGGFTLTWSVTVAPPPPDRFYLGYGISYDVGTGIVSNIIYSLTAGSGITYVLDITDTIRYQQALAFHPATGVLYAIREQQGYYNPGTLATIDIVAGTSVLIGTNCGYIVSDIAFNSKGELYGWASTIGSPYGGLIKFNLATGVATPIGTIGTLANVDGGIEFINDVLYAAISRSNGKLSIINTSTGAVSDASPYPMSGAVNPSATVLALTKNNENKLFMLNGFLGSPTYAPGSLCEISYLSVLNPMPVTPLTPTTYFGQVSAAFYNIQTHPFEASMVWKQGDQ